MKAFFPQAVIAGFLLGAAKVSATPFRHDSARAPTVKLDEGTFIGATSHIFKVNKWLGIPYAKPPIGDLRFNLPQPVAPYTGTHTVSAFGKSCPQQAFSLPVLSGLPQMVINDVFNAVYGAVYPEDEDCLTINVFAPAGLTSSSKLPVLLWLFASAFQFGSPNTYDGSGIVSHSVKIGEPVIFVSMNYRISALGFLASKEVKTAGVGNLGLRDQRLALRWVQKYISAFGGDSSKVTIWGESAGSISVSLQMLTNGGDTEGLFRAAFMQSGSPIPVGDISHGQPDYDALVNATGCSGASDTLQCLREADFKVLKTAMDNSPGIFSYQSLRLAWLPRADGDFLVDPPQKLVSQGSVANIPFVTGDCADEGTLFSISTRNITTDAELATYIHNNYFPTASAAEINLIMDAYPDTTQGSPLETGIFRQIIMPQFDRIATFQGDLVFNAPRRFFLEQRSGKQNTWSFLNRRLKHLPIIGSAHATDLLNVFLAGDMADYLIRFTVHLDPNGGDLLEWPKYTTTSRSLLTFQDNPFYSLTITRDDFRVQGFNVLTNLSLTYPM